MNKTSSREEKWIAQFVKPDGDLIQIWARSLAGGSPCVPRKPSRLAARNARPSGIHATDVENGVEAYFCDPHSPWQRGTNENTNRLLRLYLLKRTGLTG
jgi:transposase, IS30 family